MLVIPFFCVPFYLYTFYSVGSCFLHGTVSVYVTPLESVVSVDQFLSQDDSHIGPGCYVLSCLLGIQSSLAMASVAYTWTWVVCSALLILCSVSG